MHKARYIATIYDEQYWTGETEEDTNVISDCRCATRVAVYCAWH